MESNNRLSIANLPLGNFFLTLEHARRVDYHGGQIEKLIHTHSITNEIDISKAVGSASGKIAASLIRSEHAWVHSNSYLEAGS